MRSVLVVRVGMVSIICAMLATSVVLEVENYRMSAPLRAVQEWGLMSCLDVWSGPPVG